MVETLDCRALQQFLSAGLANLKLHQEEINALNVFPVPDGDTGNNMAMTLEGGVKAAAGKDTDFAVWANDFARGTLLGARGNSGVIFSQFIKGVLTTFAGVQAVTPEIFMKAFRGGVTKAYDAVINPTEGTMLTVMREGCEFLEAYVPAHPAADFSEMMEQLIQAMQVSLEHTPELLPVLKESGVIDSGGAALLAVFEGGARVLSGEAVLAGGNAEWMATSAEGVQAMVLKQAASEEDADFGYCTEFILQLQEEKTKMAAFEKQDLVAWLEQIGESIVAVQDEDLVKIHVHTFRPGEVLTHCQQFGEFISVKIENMSVQHHEVLKQQGAGKQENLQAEQRSSRKTIWETIAATAKNESIIRKKIGIVAVLNGDGLKDYFREIGADVIVDGGQTENASTEEFLNAFGYFEAEHILVLPCNSNMMMAASQAAQMHQEAKVHVVPAKTVAEGYAALSMMNLSLSVEEVMQDMERAIAETATGLITKATRDVQYENLAVTKGHFIGLSQDEILSDAEERIEAVRELLASLDDIKEKVVLVAFYGSNVEEQELNRLSSLLKEEFSWLEFGFISGGQNIYDYIFAVE